MPDAYQELNAIIAAETPMFQWGERGIPEPVESCRVYWGSHGCDRPRGHEGPHLCLSCRTADEDGWVGAPPYYGPETTFYGEDTIEAERG